MSRIIRIAISVAVLLACVAPALAAPRGARTGSERRQVPREDVLDAQRHADAWQALRGIVRRNALGPAGGRDGDLWPTIGEAVAAPDRPWVVWSRYNGTEYDLAYTRWSERAWLPARWIEGGDAIDPTAGVGDDLDPALDFDRAGRPMVAWWRDEGGAGRVYFSLYLASRWLEAIPVSEVSVDARYPSVELVGTDTVRVSFDTPEGRVRHTIRFLPPDTITDDLNPLDFRFRTDKIEVIKQNDD